MMLDLSLCGSEHRQVQQKKESHETASEDEAGSGGLVEVSHHKTTHTAFIMGTAEMSNTRRKWNDKPAHRHETPNSNS